MNFTKIMVFERISRAKCVQLIQVNQHWCSIAEFCEEDEFYCPGDSFCLPRHYICDSHRDCLDGFDEQNCTSSEGHWFDT